MHMITSAAQGRAVSGKTNTDEFAWIFNGELGLFHDAQSLGS